MKKTPRFLIQAVLTLLLFIGVMSHHAWAADPSGTNTGTAKDVQNAQGQPFLVHPTDFTRDDYWKQSKEYESFQLASAKEPLAMQLADAVGQNRIAINLVWTLLTGFMVMFMQAGFAALETGLTRSKNASHTMLMNFLVYPIGIIGFYFVGFGLMFGANPVASLGGTPTLSASNEAVLTLFGKPFGVFATGFWMPGDNAYDVGIYALFLFQSVFLDTAATIPTGTMAERWSLRSFTIYALFISAILYPIFGNWAWGGGWLAQLGVNFGLGHGYVDFAGSGVVHAIGGLCALAGALVIGPRAGKYNPDGSSNGIPGHNIPLALLGVFILAFGWFGFNAGSTLGAAGSGMTRIGIIATSTMLASAGGACSAAIYLTVLRRLTPDPTMIANGLLAGLVAVTASSGFINGTSGLIIGGVAGILVCVAVEILEKCQIDDPVGAISVHGVCGIWGVIAVGLFADGSAIYGGAWNGVEGAVKGLFYGDINQLGAQMIGVIALFGWGFGVSFVFFHLMNGLVGLRVTPLVEQEGLDIAETGIFAYPEFAKTPEEIPETPTFQGVMTKISL